jgi:hypothetical protein
MAARHVQLDIIIRTIVNRAPPAPLGNIKISVERKIANHARKDIGRTQVLRNFAYRVRPVCMQKTPMKARANLQAANLVPEENTHLKKVS